MNPNTHQPFAYQSQQPSQQPYQGYQGQPGGYQGYPGYGQPPKKKSPVLKIFALGCLGLFILLFIGCIALFFVGRSYVNKLIDQYTSTTPRAIPAVQMTPEEITAIEGRATAFADAIKQGQPTQPLVLTADEINALIQNHPDWKEVAGKVYVSMEGDRLRGEVSIPLDNLGKMGQGRYFNGAAEFSVSVQNGRLFVIVESAEVNDQPVPDQFMQGLRSENMAKDLERDNPQAADFFRRIDSIQIEDGRMIITPK